MINNWLLYGRNFRELHNVVRLKKFYVLFCILIPHQADIASDFLLCCLKKYYTLLKMGNQLAEGGCVCVCDHVTLLDGWTGRFLFCL